MHPKKNGFFILFLIGWLSLFLGVFTILSPAAPSKNQPANPGSEKVKVAQLEGWKSPPYWSSILRPVNEKGDTRSDLFHARLTSSLPSQKEGIWRGVVCPAISPKDFLGHRFRFTVQAKGKGELSLGCAEHVTKDKSGTPDIRLNWQKNPIALTEDWQEVAFEFQVMDPQLTKLHVMSEVRGNNAEACFDKASLATVSPTEVSMTATPAHTMTTPDEKVAIRVAVSKGGQPAAGVNIRTLIHLEAGTSSRTEPEGWTNIQTNPSGIAEIVCDWPAQTTSAVYRIVIAQPDSGLACTTYVELADKATCETFAAAAQKAKLLPQPAHLLFIGDSLTDFQRGYNYVDELQTWLRTSGKKVSTHNAGVGGDFTSRVWQRMNKDPKSYRPEMYDHLFDPKPSHVFFCLGHNDSKVSSASNYAQPLVPLGTFGNIYRQAIRKIQQETGARVTVISTTSSLFETCKANADKARAAGREHMLFGKPDMLEKFNAIAQKAAKETGADYVNIYEPFRAYPGKPSLFNPNDGVHLSNAGNRLIALELLKYLGR